jgi:hypothetical protein
MSETGALVVEVTSGPGTLDCVISRGSLPTGTGVDFSEGREQVRPPPGIYQLGIPYSNTASSNPRGTVSWEELPSNIWLFTHLI